MVTTDVTFSMLISSLENWFCRRVSTFTFPRSMNEIRKKYMNWKRRFNDSSHCHYDLRTQIFIVSRGRGEAFGNDADCFMLLHEAVLFKSSQSASFCMRTLISIGSWDFEHISRALMQHQSCYTLVRHFLWKLLHMQFMQTTFNEGFEINIFESSRMNEYEIESSFRDLICAFSDNWNL